MRKITVISWIICFVCLIGLADEDESFSPSHRAMVVGAETEVFVGEEPKGKVAPGSVLRVTEKKGSWLYVPARDAWIKTDKIVPIEKADAHFTDVIKQEPTAAAYHHRGIARHALGFNELAMEDLDETVKLGLKTPAVFINRANVWHSLGNDRNALADISQAIEADPENALAYNNRALIWASIGNLGKALEDSNHAIQLDPDYAAAFNNRGVTRVKQGEFKAAMKDYDRAIALFDGYAEAYANRGYAAKKTGRYRDALSDYRRAVKLAPESSQAFNDAAWLVATCPDRKIRDGERAVEYAVYACKVTDYKKAEFVDTLAAAYACAGRFEEAVKTQQQALTLLPEDARKAARERLKLYRQEQPFVDSK